MKNMIDITGVNLVEFIKKVYELSIPQGLGFLHYQEGGLTDEEAKQCIRKDDNVIINMDYIKGRACKMVVWQEGINLYIRNSWYDHTDQQLKDLLLDILPTNKLFSTNEPKNKHKISCNCLDCQKGRKNVK